MLLIYTAGFRLEYKIYCIELDEKLTNILDALTELLHTYAAHCKGHEANFDQIATVVIFEKIHYQLLASFCRN